MQHCKDRCNIALTLQRRCEVRKLAWRELRARNMLFGFQGYLWGIRDVGQRGGA